MAKLKAAVIGVGKAVPSGAKGGGHAIGYRHGKCLSNHPLMELGTCADINAENLKAFQEKFSVPCGHLDYRKMLEEDRPDVVGICTYLGLHRQIIEDCVKAGVRMICCEKPFVASVTELRAVEKLCVESGTKLVIAHIRRYFPVFQKARELFNSGAVGKPHTCIAGIDGWDLSEWGGHWIDMFRFFNNDQPVRHVMGQVRVRETRGYGHAMEDHGLAYFEFENGVRGILDGGRAMNDGLMLLVGGEGVIRILNENSMDWIGPGGKGSFSHEWMDAHGEDPYEVAWRRMYADLVEWHRGGPEPLLALPTTGKSAEVNLAAYISALRTDRVDLPVSSTSNEWPVEILARRQKDVV